MTSPPSEIAHRNGVIVVVDNTFMTLLLQKPSTWARTSACSPPQVPAGHADYSEASPQPTMTRSPSALHLADDYRRNARPPTSYRLLQEVKTPVAPDPAAKKYTIEVINYLEAHPAIEACALRGFAQRV